MTDDSTIEVQDLVVRTTADPPIVLVEDVAFEVASGEVFGVMGETGAGKTVSMRAVLGLLPRGTVGAGTLHVGARRFDLAAPADLRRLLGIETTVVLQNPAGMFDPLMRIGPQMIEGVARRKVMSRRQAVERRNELLSEMGFDDPEEIARLHPHQLSGGMAQRIAIALALLPRPRLVVVDEPTSALDANVRVEVLSLVRRLAADEDAAVFFVSHDLGLVSHFCDSVAVMYGGRVVEAGPTGVVLHAPRHPYTAALLRCSTTLTRSPRVPLPVIGGSQPRPGRWPPGCLFEPRCPVAFDRCGHERPALRSFEEHRAACHLAERSEHVATHSRTA